MGKRDIENYVDSYGVFDFVKYTYELFNDSMKQTLDMGTLLSSDPQKLRAYKEQIKKDFKSRWEALASVLEQFGIADKCRCFENQYCKICGGSRYLTSDTMQPPDVEIGIVTLDDNEKLKVQLLDSFTDKVDNDHKMSAV